MGVSTKPTTPCKALSAEDFPLWGCVSKVLGWDSFSFCLIAGSFGVFPPLDRHEGVLGSVLSANVSVIIKCVSVGLTSSLLGRMLNHVATI